LANSLETWRVWLYPPVEAIAPAHLQRRQEIRL
jgi:hypothetical protein